MSAEKSIDLKDVVTYSSESTIFRRRVWTILFFVYFLIAFLLPVTVSLFFLVSTVWHFPGDLHVYLFIVFLFAASIGFEYLLIHFPKKIKHIWKAYIPFFIGLLFAVVMAENGLRGIVLYQGLIIMLGLSLSVSFAPLAHTYKAAKAGIMRFIVSNIAELLFFSFVLGLIVWVSAIEMYEISTYAIVSFVIAVLFAAFDYYKFFRI